MAKDVTSFCLISDKSTEIQGSEYWKNCQFSILSFSLVFDFCMQISQVTSLLVGKLRVMAARTDSNIFEYFHLNILVLLAD